MGANRVVWFFIGAAAGAAFGLLATPGSGRENVRWAADRGLEGANRLIGEERVRRGRRAVERGAEAASFARDTVGLAKRGSRLKRPLDEE